MRRLNRSFAVGVGALALLACGSDEASGPCTAAGVVVADPTAWRVLASDAEDPWGPRPDRCPSTRHRTEIQGEQRWHEVETRDCAAATLHQVLRLDLCRGDTVGIDVWHFPITEGDGDWELRLGVSDPDGAFDELGAFGVPVPEIATTFPLRFELPRRLRDGETLWLRLSNHGTNTWNLYPLVTVEAVR